MYVHETMVIVDIPSLTLLRSMTNHNSFECGFFTAKTGLLCGLE